MGEEILIVRGREPVARLVPAKEPKGRRRLGIDKGMYAVPDTFDAPLPDEVLVAFHQ
jgi:antitoxin (DNA-binding transcriptional repressor) of toxin-antitoxin stability system